MVAQALHNGGAEKQLLLMMRYLAERGYNCSLFTLSTTPRHPRITRLIEQMLSAGGALMEPSWIAARTGAQWLRLAKLLRGLEDLVLWSWGSRADLVCKCLSVIYPQAVLVCSLRDANLARMQKLRVVERFLHERVARYVSNSWLNCEYLESVVPNVIPRSRVIYNALEPRELNEVPVELPSALQALRVVVLGNILPHKKGYDHILEVAAEVQNRHLPVKIRIAGRDLANGWLQERIRTGELHGVVEYCGESQAAGQFLRSGHVYLLMSRAEGTPNALLEAMNLGLPCIATKVGDIERWAHDGENIRLVEVGNTSGVVGILGEFLANWGDGLRLGKAGRELCQGRFTPERMVTDTLAVLDEICRRPARAEADGIGARSTGGKP